MDQTPPSPAHGRARLAAALDRVDAALAEPDGAWLEKLASLGVWGAWLRWILQLLAFEFALAGAEPRQLPGAEPCAVDQLSPAALDRKIDRLIEAAARLWRAGDETAARPRRPRWRGLVRLVLRWLGYPHGRLWPVFVAVCRIRSAPVLALCKPEGRPKVGSHDRPCQDCALLEAPGCVGAPSGAAASSCAPGPSSLCQQSGSCRRLRSSGSNTRDAGIHGSGDRTRCDGAPHFTPVKRLDETRVARRPVLKWVAPAEPEKLAAA